MSRLLASRGVTLVELLIALLLLEITGVAALSAILTTEQLHRRTTLAVREDAARWTSYRHAEVSPDCDAPALPRAVPLTLAASAVRPALPVTLGCGR